MGRLLAIKFSLGTKRIIHISLCPPIDPPSSLPVQVLGEGQKVADAIGCGAWAYVLPPSGPCSGEDTNVSNLPCQSVYNLVCTSPPISM